MKVLITGGGGGIGFAVATEFAKAGYEVVLADLNEALVQSKANELCNQGFHASGVLLDLNSQSSIEQTAASVGAVDILINNAGIQHVARLEDFPEQKWQQLLQVMLTGLDPLG